MGLEGLDVVLIVLGAFAGGIVNGMTGFGTGLAAMPFWLAATSPPVAAQLAAACGAWGQLQTLPSFWRLIRRDIAVPMVLGGLIGLPVGTFLLPYARIEHFRLGIGALLVIYCSFMLWGGARPWLSIRSRLADGLIGVLGGVLGGLGGISGPPPAVWASLNGWRKDDRRGVFMAFNGTILTMMLVSSAVAGLANWEFLRALALALPGTIVGAYIGGKLYWRLNEQRFNQLVLLLLLAMGVMLVGTTLFTALAG